MEEKVQRLSEGMDFIEESSSWTNESLSFKDISEIEISEAKTEKSPYKILGKAVGCFAPIGEFSRNKRLYSSDLWPTVLANEEFKSRLDHRAIFGCISHEDKLVDDVDIREGKVSHIVTKLEVKEDLKGKPYLYGELEILDTPAGRILEAMYKGGADLYVSSRAAGKLIPVPGQNYSLVRPEQYHVHCFDVVCRPGFLQARPAFEAVSVESVQHAVSESLPVTTSDAHITAAPVVNESSEVAELKGQVEKLAKIIEKVVDDVYEEEPVEEAKEKTADDYEFDTVRKNALANPNLYGGRYTQKSKKEAKREYEEDKKRITSEALDSFTKLMINSNISEEAFAEVLEILLKGNN